MGEGDEDLACGHLIAGRDPDLGDDSGAAGGQRVQHLHRFDDGDRIATAHLVTDGDRDLGHDGREWRHDGPGARSGGSGGRCPAFARGRHGVGVRRAVDVHHDQAVVEIDVDGTGVVGWSVTDGDVGDLSIDAHEGHGPVAPVRGEAKRPEAMPGVRP